MSESDNEAKAAEKTFVEGLDFYFDGGLMVLTERLLRNRGFCCGSGCRHCPYSDKERAEAILKKKLF
jgi:hypothetical protein